MARMIHCVKLNKEAEGLAVPPYPGEIGKRIWESISQEAWQMWLQHQTRIINEYRLAGADQRARQLLREEMEKFLFGEGEVNQPEGYVPPKA